MEPSPRAEMQAELERLRHEDERLVTVQDAVAESRQANLRRREWLLNTLAFAAR